LTFEAKKRQNEFPVCIMELLHKLGRPKKTSEKKLKEVKLCVEKLKLPKRVNHVVEDVLNGIAYELHWVRGEQARKKIDAVIKNIKKSVLRFYKEKKTQKDTIQKIRDLSKQV